MKVFNEKKFLSLVSFVLKIGVILFILLSLLSYIVKPISPILHLKIINTAIFILIITPLLRIIMLLYGFQKLKEYKYSFYALTILILLILGISFKI
ncbi:MAG: hypothetical protein K6357_00875 [Elusimicrobiota bacterium]